MNECIVMLIFYFFASFRLIIFLPYRTPLTLMAIKMTMVMRMNLLLYFLSESQKIADLFVLLSVRHFSFCLLFSKKLLEYLLQFEYICVIFFGPNVLSPKYII